MNGIDSGLLAVAQPVYVDWSKANLEDLSGSSLFALESQNTFSVTYTLTGASYSFSEDLLSHLGSDESVVTGDFTVYVDADSVTASMFKILDMGYHSVYGYKFLGYYCTTASTFAPDSYDYKVGDLISKGKLSAASKDEDWYAIPYYVDRHVLIEYFSATSSNTPCSSVRTVIDEEYQVSDMSYPAEVFGYEQVGWKTLYSPAVYVSGESVETPHVFGSGISVGGTVKLYPALEKKTYTLTFHCGDGTGDDYNQTITYGENTNLLGFGFKAPDDKKFIGWSLTDSSEDVDFYDKQVVLNIGQPGSLGGFAEVVNLYALYGAGDATLVFHFNYDADSKSMTFPVGQNINLPRNELFSRDGYRIVGWRYLGGEGMDPVTGIQKGRLSVGQLFDMYAVWEKCSYKVNYVSLENEVIATLEYPVNSMVPVYDVPHEKVNGLRVDYWSDINDREYRVGETFCAMMVGNAVLENADFTVLDNDGLFENGVLESETNMVFHGRERTYTVSYNGNGGVGSIPDSVFTVDEIVRLSVVDDENLRLENYDFNGWSVVKGGPVVYGNGAKVKNLVGMDGCVVLYASWKPKDWTGKKISDFREYKNIYVNNCSENPIGDKIGLGYVSNMSDITFKVDGYTYFHFPMRDVEGSDNNKFIDLSSTTLVYDGARYGSAPYLSDRIYKLRYDYQDNSPYGRSQPLSSNNGTWLCTWLSGNVLDKDSEPKWYDRWFDPNLAGAVPPGGVGAKDVVRPPKDYEVETVVGCSRFVNMVVDGMHSVAMGSGISRLSDLDSESKTYAKIAEVASAINISVAGALSSQTVSIVDAFNSMLKGRVYDMPSEMSFDYGAYYKYWRVGDATISAICEPIMADSIDNISDWAAISASEYVEYLNCGPDVFKSDSSDPYFDTSEHGVKFNGINQVLKYGNGEMQGHPVSGNISVVVWIRNDDWKNTTCNSIIDSYYEGGWKIGVINRAFTPFTFYAGNSENRQLDGTMCVLNMDGDLVGSRKFWKTDDMEIQDVVHDFDMYLYILDSRDGCRIHKVDYNGNRIATSERFGTTGVCTNLDMGPISAGAFLYAYGYSNGRWNAYRMSRYDLSFERVEIVEVRDDVVKIDGQYFTVSGRNSWISGNGAFTNDGIVLDGNGNTGTIKLYTIDDADIIDLACDYDDNVWVLKGGTVEKYEVRHHVYTKVDYFDLPDSVKPSAIDMVSYNRNGRTVDMIYVVCRDDELILVYNTDGKKENEISTKPFFVVPCNRRRVSMYDWYRRNKEYTNCLYVAIRDFSGIKMLKCDLDEISDYEWHQVAFCSMDYEVKMYVDCKNVDTVELESHASYKYDTSIVFGGSSGKIRSMMEESNILNSCYAGYIDCFSLFGRPLDHEDLYYLYMSKFNMDDLHWSYTNNVRFYVEKVDRKYKFKMPGSKSGFYRIRISGSIVENLSDEARSMIEESVKRSVERLAPAYSRLIGIEWN